jgi:hypothetical protein
MDAQVKIEELKHTAAVRNATIEQPHSRLSRVGRGELLVKIGALEGRVRELLRVVATLTAACNTAML